MTTITPDRRAGIEQALAELDQDFHLRAASLRAALNHSLLLEVLGALEVIDAKLDMLLTAGRAAGAAAPPSP